jgi:hypothetical protein
LPFPTYCAQPAMLRRASTAAIPKASFFIGVVPLSWPVEETKATTQPLVLKRHIGHFNKGQGGREAAGTHCDCLRRWRLFIQPSILAHANLYSSSMTL